MIMTTWSVFPPTGNILTIEESHLSPQKASQAFMIVQSHQVKFLQALGRSGMGCESRTVGVISTES